MASVTGCEVPSDAVKTQNNCGRVLAVTVPVERVIQSAHKIRLTPHINVLAHQFMQSHGPWRPLLDHAHSHRRARYGISSHDCRQT
jgi:hypothetical protein